MDFKEILRRVENGLDTVLLEIENELEIENGDVSPLQLYKLDQLTIEIAKLFQELITQNMEV